MSVLCVSVILCIHVALTWIKWNVIFTHTRTHTHVHKHTHTQSCSFFNSNTVPLKLSFTNADSLTQNFHRFLSLQHMSSLLFKTPPSSLYRLFSSVLLYLTIESSFPTSAILFIYTSLFFRILFSILGYHTIIYSTTPDFLTTPPIHFHS